MIIKFFDLIQHFSRHLACRSLKRRVGHGFWSLNVPSHSNFNLAKLLSLIFETSEQSEVQYPRPAACGLAGLHCIPRRISCQPALE
jgi:hypothetical protein